MKKLTSTLGVFAATAAIAAAFAMSPAPTKVEAKASNDPHWFSLSNGDYLGQDTQTNKQSQCGEDRIMDCVVGYDEYDFENNVPESDPIILEGDKELQ
ncbi:hypothetical protein [Pedobacter xixiisoli]|uniref:Uncharacterized protein n=1 Tax=Pedobacter xixiisoli TaxID=1476464 RepID=A0A286A712_9SPHI|nr:hypothetical protein [Pedobacter xixiisoli]SOD17723.1 hypothetical protein SAMN06297358_2655 [Pedobacter xixiisoli]